MKKIIMIIGVVFLLLLSNMAGATYSGSIKYVFDGDGTPTYPNSGYIYVNVSSLNNEGGRFINSALYNTDGNIVDYRWQGCGYVHRGEGCSADLTIRRWNGINYYDYVSLPTPPQNGFNSDCNSVTLSNTATNWGCRSNTYTTGCSAGYSHAKSYNSLAISLNGFYNLSGNTSCVEEINLYMLNEKVSTYIVTDDTYIFTNLVSGIDYSVEFPNEHWYNFTCMADETHDYNACEKCTFNLHDDCANLLYNPITTIFINCTDQIYQGSDNPITILKEGNYTQYDQLRVIIDTHDMAEEKIVYADNAFNVFNLFHQSVGWDLQTHVYDNFTKEEIEGVKVLCNQSCRIDGYPTYTPGLTNDHGLVTTYQLSNQNFAIECEHADYHDYFSVFVSNFDAQKSTYMVEIYLDNTSSQYANGNETLPETPCSIAWSNNDNLVIHEINDTEDARLHYMAGNATTSLYLERWSDAANMWLIVGSSDTLSPLEQGYIQYTPANWTEGETTMYRGRLWALNCYCDDTSTLKVWNNTDTNMTIFTNLTAGVSFINKMSGSQVSPSDPIKVRAYAASNNTTLLTIDLKLYNESTLVETESLSLFDWYSGSSFEPYMWYPEYTYADGYNYTVKMLGLGNALIDIDTVYANSSSPFFNNYELTVFVKDNYNQQVTHSTVFIEGWGSISTGDKNWVSITGFQPGTYQYKATKGGYISSGWASVDMDGHESVTCILVSETQTSITASKMTNAEIKAFFIPLMYLLLIMMLLGAFKFACGGK